ncbi:MAG TPA: type 1 glutamine amidotransferase domain-containing protein, partial [Methanomicrobiales archaeon]|nr:type 1 glutamine amidotransferase domain-containing protein [Methanomicrobiales archaeon]
MSTIAVLIGRLFEDVEYIQPADAFRAAGHDLVHVGIEEGSIVNGKKRGTSVGIERAVKDVSVDDFDALFIPGGCSPDDLRSHDEAVQFVRSFVESGKPVLAICHAPQIMITAEVLKGRKVTGWKSIVQDIKNAGAQFVDAAVVEDGNLLSSRNPGDLPSFIDASLTKLERVTTPAEERMRQPGA